MKRIIEIAIIIVILWFLILVPSYHYWFEKICESMSLKEGEKFNINKLWNCRDSFICYDSNIETYKNKVESFSCKKKIIDVLEKDYYKSKI